MARRLLMTAFGWNDPGGGTTVPRLAAKELARRGWEVTVFYAAVEPAPGEPAYHLSEREDEGVRLLGVHNRAHGLWDHQGPLRELDDPPITAAFAAELDRCAPDVVHFHNLHNLGAALVDEVAARGIPSWFSTHNYWLVCPRAYLMTADGTICAGPGDGRRCATCTGGREPADYARRLAEIRARVSRGVTGILAVSEAVRRTLVNAGYPAEMVDVVRQGMPHDMEIWERLGRDRQPGRVGAGSAPLTVAFLGSAYPHKGPQLLVEAAQRTRTRLRVEIHGEVPDVFAPRLRALDARGVCELRGAFSTDRLADVLAGVDVAVLPSMWWDCAPLAAAECLAARVPLVVPRLGGFAEAVRDGVDGLVIEPLDPDALAAALDRLAAEPGLLERLQGGIEPPRAFAGYVDELEAYYAGERPGRIGDASDEIAVLCEGDPSFALGPARVQRLGSADPPLPHAADVEVRTTWPPARRAASSGRLVIVQPAGAPPASLPPLDELWVADAAAAADAAEGDGIDPARIVVAPADPVARLRALAARPLRAGDPKAAEPWPLAEDATLRVLATPAWRGADRLTMLLAQWCAATTPVTGACLYLLADPGVDGEPEAIERRVLAACQASGADLDAAADVTVLLEPATAERDARLHAATSAYVPLHRACAGHERIARATGS
ncbi:MAG TPA: glycosyltransferase, partial [Conexibacter sp.]|nr:glycosyltransferase [Conexibacter sp.]